MGLLKYVKYGIRFLFLQTLLTFFTIFYFDRFLIGDYFDGYLIIRDNLLEDRDRFYPFVTNDFIKTDIYIAIFIFVKLNSPIEFLNVTILNFLKIESFSKLKEI